MKQIDLTNEFREVQQKINANPNENKAQWYTLKVAIPLPAKTKNEETGVFDILNNSEKVGRIEISEEALLVNFVMYHTRYVYNISRNEVNEGDVPIFASLSMGMPHSNTGGEKMLEKIEKLVGAV